MSSPKARLTLDGVEEYLTYDITRAEIMDYLLSAYGPVFLDDLIKHLPQVHAEAFDFSPESRQIRQ